MLVIEGNGKSIVLPNPQLSDTEDSQNSIRVKRAMDGTRYSHVRRSGRSTFSWAFLLTRLKYLQLIDFYADNCDVTCTVTLQDGTVIRGVFRNSPLSGKSEYRGYEIYDPVNDWTIVNEFVSVNIDFDGVILT